MVTKRSMGMITVTTNTPMAIHTITITPITSMNTDTSTNARMAMGTRVTFTIRSTPWHSTSGFRKFAPI